MKSTEILHLAAALTAAFIVFLVFPEVQVQAETVPEGAVWTQPHTVFWEGQHMVSLRCSFQGKPLLVSWSKDDSAGDLVGWANGVRGGRMFEEGSVNITDDYSLVFMKPIKLKDTGRYICRVYLDGNPIDNSTHVTVRDFQIQTAPRLTAWKGETASLPCGLPFTPYRVQWVSGSSGEVGASYTDGIFTVPTGVTGRFSMEEDFSLTINEVRVPDEAVFTCEVFSLDSRRWRNSTELIVNAYGVGPNFDGCQRNEYCTEEVRSREFQLSCAVHGAKPDVNLSLTAAGNSALTFDSMSFERREDGTRDQSINAKAQMTSDQSVETFTCLASGVAVPGTKSTTKTVTVTSERLHPVSVTLFTVTVTVTTAVILILTLLFRCFFTNRRRTALNTSQGACPCVFQSDSTDDTGNQNSNQTDKFLQTKGTGTEMGRKQLSDNNGCDMEPNGKA